MVNLASIIALYMVEYTRYTLEKAGERTTEYV